MWRGVESIGLPLEVLGRVGWRASLLFDHTSWRIQEQVAY